ncbi:hypothetical protein GCM10008935_00780 [Alkalibacillus silvisoli]|uniref:MFS transporter n=1 Tax=Alkalibacillus silvisoli TaxID=392823 RepID=A0ABP3JDG7_9BACI
MTQDQHSRSLTNIYAQILILSGTLLTMVISEPLAQIVGWTVVASIYGVIVVIALLITFKNVKERTELSTLSGEDGVAAKEGFKALLKNKYWCKRQVKMNTFC